MPGKKSNVLMQSIWVEGTLFISGKKNWGKNETEIFFDNFEFLKSMYNFAEIIILTYV